MSPDLIKKITQGEINEFFIQHLSELNTIMAFVKANQGKHIRAFKEVGPELERLRLKSSEKIRDFLLKKIEPIKALSTNASMIQQNVLLKYKDLYFFLVERYFDVAMEIRQTYISYASTYYTSLFDKYIKGINRIQVSLSYFYNIL